MFSVMFSKVMKLLSFSVHILGGLRYIRTYEKEEQIGPVKALLKS